MAGLSLVRISQIFCRMDILDKIQACFVENLVILCGVCVYRMERGLIL